VTAEKQNTLLFLHAVVDLFRGGILQSGSFLSPWAFQRKPKEIAFATAAFLNDTFQTNTDSNALLEFLQSVDAKSIDVASEKYASSVRVSGVYLFFLNEFAQVATLQTEEILQGYYWGPFVEVKNPDAFLTKKMYGLLEAGNVVGVPILIGITSEEGIMWNKGDLQFQKYSIAILY
jgi:carboxylesterase type B